MERIELFEQLDISIMKLYDELDLKDLHNALGDAEHFASKLTSVTRKKDRLKDFFDFKFYDNLYFISRDLKYSTALLFVLRPYINNPLKEEGTYLKNHYDSRYFMYANFAYQLTYNYFDQIGDLLATYFKTGLEGNVYFKRVIHNFPKEYQDNKEYEWFSALLKNELKHIVSTRDEIVHNYHLETELFYTVMGAKLDTSQLKESTKTKLEYPEFFQTQLKICIDALTNAINLIALLPDRNIAV